MTNAVGEPSALARCVGNEAEFVQRYWGQRPLVRQAGQTRDNFTDLLDLAEVDRLVTSSGLRTPAFRLVRDGKPMPESSYTRSIRLGGVPLTGLADPAKVLAAIDDGATLVLQGLHRYREPLRTLCRELEAALGCTSQVNAYFTPPGARGLAVHSDPHDVLVLQAFGAKRWEIHGPDGVLDVLLEPGESLYLPLGTPHAATAQDKLSGHITVGLVPQSWRQTLSAVVDDLLAEPALDDRLPVGWHDDPDLLTAELTSRLDELRTALDKADPHAGALRLTERFWTSRPPALGGALVDRVRLAALGEDSVVRRRRGAMCQRRRDRDVLVVWLGDRTLRMPAWVEPAVEQLATAGSLRVSEVSLDPQSRLVLVRRLVREGLLEVIG